MSTTTIYVAANVITANQYTGGNEPPIIVEDKDGHKHYGHEVYVMGASRFVYSRGKPNEAGAHLWCETKADVVVYDTASGKTKTVSIHPID